MSSSSTTGKKKLLSLLYRDNNSLQRKEELAGIEICGGCLINGFFVFQYSLLHLLEQHQHSPRNSGTYPGNHRAFLGFSEEIELFICISSELC